MPANQSPTIHHVPAQETAALIRQSLAEAFPKFKFSVKTKKYSGGASVSVNWTSGPNEAQVKAVIGRFRGGYFDSSIDFQGKVWAMMDGKQVSFSVDFLNLTRAYTAADKARALAAVVRRYADNYRKANKELPTVEQWQEGRLIAETIPGTMDAVDGETRLVWELSRTLDRQSDRLAVKVSKTAAKVFVTHDDGYSRAHGSGMSAVDLAEL